MRQGELAGMPEPAALRLLAADGQVLVTHGRTLVYRYEADDTGMRNLAIVALTDAGRRIDEVALLFGLTATYVSMLRGRARQGGRTALAGPSAKHRHVGRGEPKEEGHLVDPAAGVGQCHDRQVAHPGVVRLVPVNQRPPVGHQYLPIGGQNTQRGRLRHPLQLALSHTFSLSQSQRILDEMARRKVLLTGHSWHYLRRSAACAAVSPPPSTWTPSAPPLTPRRRRACQAGTVARHTRRSGVWRRVPAAGPRGCGFPPCCRAGACARPRPRGSETSPASARSPDRPAAAPGA